MRSPLDFRAGTVLAGTVCAFIIAISGTACGVHSAPKAAKYCAIMADSIGLYPGNAVTQMGYRIGTVESIVPRDRDVEVHFAVESDRPLPRQVKAVTRSISILADRSLELVGNYKSGAKLPSSTCIARDHSFTPMSISQVIGSATNFVNGINPSGSQNIQDALRGVDAAVNGNGEAARHLLTTSSALLDNPEQPLGDLAAVVRNVAKLTTMLKDNRPPLKEVINNTPLVIPDVVNSLGGISGLSEVIDPLVRMVADIEQNLGDNITLLLDTVSDALRHLSPHYKGIANILNPVPRFINTISAWANNNDLNMIRWRPPLFRVATPNGLALCGYMNSSVPGSCADVNGQPYAVDIALLQYVLMEAQHR